MKRQGDKGTRRQGDRKTRTWRPRRLHRADGRALPGLPLALSPPLPPPMPTTFTITRPVQFAETDMAGSVHFANYFRMMEEVEHAFFRSIGLSVSMQHDGMHIGWPRVSAACEYFGPIRF